MTVEHRVIGPPGTGKTTYLARQIELAASKFGKDAVMVASLTRAAATEVAGRDTGLHRRQIGTLHAHALHALDRPAIAESKDGIKAWNEWVATRNPQLRVTDRTSVDPENAPPEGPMAATDGERLLAEVGVLRARMTPPEFWRSACRGFWQEWCDFKRERGYVDFTDLIERALEEVEQPLGKPIAMFVDEAQDSSRLEMALIRKWGATCQQLVIVGDPFQNLYEWRGSEPEAFDSAPAASERVLEQSYRVPRAVQEYSVEWARPLVAPGKRFPEYRPREEEGELRLADARFNDPESMLRLIEEDLARFPDESVDHPTVMVLATCGYMLDPLIGALKSRGIPFGNPYRPNHGGWNPMRGAERLRRFLKPDPETWGDAAAPWTWEDLAAWVDPLQAKGVLQRGSKGIIAGRNVDDRFDEQHEAAVTAGDLVALFEAQQLPGVLGVDPDWWFRNLLASRQRQFIYPREVMRRRGRGALLERPRVCVGTIHSVKGGQADSVYVFPDMSRQGYWNGWRSELGRPSVIRQFYVAFTRARHTLTVCEQATPEYVPLPRPAAATRV